MLKPSPQGNDGGSEPVSKPRIGSYQGLLFTVSSLFARIWAPPPPPPPAPLAAETAALQSSPVPMPPLQTQAASFRPTLKMAPSGPHKRLVNVPARPHKPPTKGYTHTTASLMPAEERAAYIARLREDPVLGPVLRLVSDTLE